MVLLKLTYLFCVLFLVARATVKLVENKKIFKPFNVLTLIFKVVKR